MALMVLTSVSCKKDNLATHLKGTKWVDIYEGEFVEVVSFEGSDTFTLYSIKESKGEIDGIFNCKMVECKSDRILFKFDPPIGGEDSKYVFTEGMVTLEDGKLCIYLTENNWTKTDGIGGCYIRNDEFDLSKYKINLD